MTVNREAVMILGLTGLLGAELPCDHVSPEQGLDRTLAAISPSSPSLPGALQGCPHRIHLESQAGASRVALLHDASELALCPDKGPSLRLPCDLQDAV